MAGMQVLLPKYFCTNKVLGTMKQIIVMGVLG
uniref:Uncharacterized protein n=1 Tax=Anguilla anguilla TaxID=7936 RepID=A0A0E9V6R9_ANGAN